MSGDLVNACMINTVCHTHVPTGQKVILLQKESVARGNPVCCLSHRVMGSKKSMVFDELRTSCIEFFIFILTQQYNQHSKCKKLNLKNKKIEF